MKEKLQHEQGRLTRLTAEFGATPDAQQRQELDARATLVADVRGLHDELTRVAPLWNPDLNDGVIINYAPLWRLIAHKPWHIGSRVWALRRAHSSGFPSFARATAWLDPCRIEKRSKNLLGPIPMNGTNRTRSAAAPDSEGAVCEIESEWSSSALLFGYGSM